ncbi:translation initiation factor IF-2-like isoform X2 [Falco rusticolus]|uniref:translation initiation factor IF-2-like isoform X2 n=1 Tax=Falco rusticolus TaxID=120794 RepID=UPI0018868363|nr:translation initiation factor IF-2-like isoform X2 [Falco rusticolus]
MRRSCSVLAAAPRCPRASHRAPAATSAHGATPGLPGPQATRPGGGAARPGLGAPLGGGSAHVRGEGGQSQRSAAKREGSGMRPAAGGAVTLPEALRATSGCAAAAGRLRERPGRRGPRGRRRLRGAPAPSSGPRGRLSAGRAAAAAWRAAGAAPRPAAAAGGAAALVIEQLKKRAVWSQLLPKHETEFMGVCHPPNKEDGTAYPQQTWQAMLGRPFWENVKTAPLTMATEVPAAQGRAQIPACLRVT